MLELSHVSKSFGTIRALTDVSLEFRSGEIHGLIGENGAGKSTAIRILTGIHQPDAGEVRLDGVAVRFRDHRDALARGIGIVNQELVILPDASVAENIMIDKLPARGGVFIDWRKTRAVAAAHMARVGLDVPPDRLVRGLSAARKQLIQVARALSSDARVLLLDEPTSSLTEHESHRLFGLLRDLRSKGVAIIFVSHKLDEVLAVCDRVSVLRDGRHVGTREARSVASRDLVGLMLGRTTNDDHLGVLSPDWKREVLRAEHVARDGRANDVSFTLHRGEILGFYGLVGSGRTELARILVGEDAMDSGSVRIDGSPVHIGSVREALYRHRLGYVTENRKEEGLMLFDSVETNLTMAIWPRLRRRFTRRIDARASAAAAEDSIASLEIRTSTRRNPVGHLSGGNQQKVSIGKWLAAECDILIIDEPTVGVDVGAKQQIHRLIWDLAGRQGRSLIVISSDLPELVRIVNRLLVFREHRIVGEVCDVDVKRKTYADVSAEIAPYFA